MPYPFIDMNKPAWTHDCESCQFLGATIGGGKLVDCYVHDSRGAVGGFVTLIARYSSQGSHYYSTQPEYANLNGHAELVVANAMWKLKESLALAKASLEA